MLRTGKIIFAMVITISMLFSATSICHSNAAEPPSIVIIVPDAPDDLEISIGYDGEYIKADKIDKVIETYYVFYLPYLGRTKDYHFRIDTGEESFEIVTDTRWEQYNNTFTLDLKNQTLTPGKSLSRSIILVSTRIILTLIIEACVFWIFGYRQKESWLVFLCINLLTQGVLNIWLNGFTPMTSYLIFQLIIGEFHVFVAELVAFLVFIKEHSRRRTALYVITANFISLIAGGYLISILPI